MMSAFDVWSPEPKSGGNRGGRVVVLWVHLSHDTLYNWAISNSIGDQALVYFTNTAPAELLQGLLNIFRGSIIISRGVTPRPSM